MFGLLPSPCALGHARRCFTATQWLMSHRTQATASNTHGATLSTNLLARFPTATVQVRDEHIAAEPKARRKAIDATADADAFDDEDDLGEAGYKASVASRVGGFPVTMAVAVSHDSPQDACDEAISLALCGDLDACLAQDDPVFGKLRYLALGLGRMLRFTITADPGNPVEGLRASCVVYERDDWHLSNKHRRIHTSTSETHSGALLASMYGVCAKYEQEAALGHRAREDLEELLVFLRPLRKTVKESLTKQQIGSSTKHAAQCVVTDAYGNEYSVASGNVAAPYAALRSCALQVYKHELNAPATTLVTQLRWQVDAMCDRTLRGRFGGENEVAVDFQGHRAGTKATLYYGNRELCSASGESDYRAELNVYAFAVEEMLSRHPRAACDMPFKTVAALERAYSALERFSVLDQLKGSKVTPFSVLGVCSAKHWGVYYASNTTALEGAVEHYRTQITVADRGEQRLIAGATASHKNPSLRNAALSALRQNFPLQFAEVRDREDFVAATRGADNSKQQQEQLKLKYRKLPRAERVEKANNFWHLISALGEEELGWQQVTRDATNNARGLWCAEVRTRDVKDGSWTVLGKSPFLASKKDAMKLAMYKVGTQYFPAETEQYIELGRDMSRGDLNRLTRPEPFAADNSLRHQCEAILNADAPAGAEPARVVLRQDEDGLTVSVERGSAALSHVSGTCNFHKMLQQALGAAAAKGDDKRAIDRLFDQHRKFTPALVMTINDFSKFVWETLMGVDVTVEATNDNMQWHASAFLDLQQDGIGAIVGSATHTSKKEAVKFATIDALRSHFADLLGFYRRTTVELQAIADEVLHATPGGAPPARAAPAVAAAAVAPATPPVAPGAAPSAPAREAPFVASSARRRARHADDDGDNDA